SYRPLKAGGRFSMKERIPSRMSSLLPTRACVNASSAKRVSMSAWSDRLSKRFERPMAKVGPWAGRSAQSRAVRARSPAGTALVEEAEAVGVVGGEVVGEEDELLRLVEAQVPRQEEASPRIERDAAPHEDLDEAGIVGGKDEVTGVGQVGAEARGDAVDGG